MYRVVLLVLCVQASLAALPLGWKACKMSAGDYKKCLAQQIEFAISTLKNGDKKLGVFPIDPLTFDSLLIDQSNGPVAIKLSFKNFTFNGLSKCKVLDIKNDWKEMKTSLFFEKTVTKGAYKIGGKMLILPIQGEGPSTLTWTNLTVSAKLTFREVDRKGKTYFEVPQFLVDINPMKLNVNFENLFHGDKALGNNMNSFMNENWEEIIKDLKPAITRALSQGFTRIANQVFAKIPKNEVQIK